MPLTLNRPLRWRQANADERAALNNLQGNILKSHGRSHTCNVFLRFAVDDVAGARCYIAWLGAQTTSAWQQLKAADAFRRSHKSAGPFIAVLLSASGYRKLGVAAAQIPGNAAFKAGLKARRALLNDPAVNKWDASFKGDIDATILIAHDSAANTKIATARLLAKRPDSVALLVETIGHAYENAKGDGIEHFGYVDGRSQPLLLAEDIEREAKQHDGIHLWDPAFPLKQVLVRSPGGGPNDFGSYVVLRKLEQNVKGFNQREQQLAKALGLKAEDRDLAGAMVVGRFRDGTPLSLQQAAGMRQPIPNNFNYVGDELGNKCPFHSHIRKSNPRGESVVKGRDSLQRERARLIVRRGISYEDSGKARKTKTVGAGIEFTDQPTRGVSLLFICYQQDIVRQFEAMQRDWINDENFIARRTGIDPCGGQGKKSAQHWPLAWGSEQRKAFSFSGFVALKGGEYFFAPPISFLKSLVAKHK
jgi:Dyp-type peroxidase family